MHRFGISLLPTCRKNAFKGRCSSRQLKLEHVALLSLVQRMMVCLRLTSLRHPVSLEEHATQLSFKYQQDELMTYKAQSVSLRSGIRCRTCVDQ